MPHAACLGVAEGEAGVEEALNRFWFRDSTLPVKTAGAYADVFSIGPELMQNH